MNESNLKPCPFCGATAVNGTVSVECFRGRYLVECGCDAPDCGCGARVTGPGWYADEDYFETEAEAIAAWNRRAPYWIPVRDRLPIECQRVLLIDDEECYIGTHEDVDAGGYWFRDGDRDYPCDPTHWMPLPKPPGMTDE